MWLAKIDAEHGCRGGQVEVGLICENGTHSWFQYL